MDTLPEAPSGPLRGSRIAFFGGSFDPPHLGHLAVARAAQSALRLDTVLFAPVGTQPLKAAGATAPFEDRLAMTRLAIAGEPGFAISLADAPRDSGAANYTLETLLGLRAGMPPGGELYCLMGADSFLGLRRWHRAAEIPFAASLIVASRPGERLDGLTAQLPSGLTLDETPETGSTGAVEESRCYRLHNAAGKSALFYVLPGLHVEISASQIREQVRDTTGGAAPVQQFVPAAVADYIRSRGLYR
jgi:nicotinate-nucleotide adenylyltransferase